MLKKHDSAAAKIKGSRMAQGDAGSLSVQVRGTEGAGGLSLLLIHKLIRLN